MIRFATDAITSFSIGPLRLAIVARDRVRRHRRTAGAGHAVPLAQRQRRAGLVEHHGGVAFFAAVQLIVLGIIGEYLGRLVNEVKGRPLFLIDTINAGGREPRGAGRVLAAAARCASRCDECDRGGGRSSVRQRASSAGQRGWGQLGSGPTGLSRVLETTCHSTVMCHGRRRSKCPQLRTTDALPLTQIPKLEVLLIPIRAVWSRRDRPSPQF